MYINFYLAPLSKKIKMYKRNYSLGVHISDVNCLLLMDINKHKYAPELTINHSIDINDMCVCFLISFISETKMYCISLIACQSLYMYCLCAYSMITRKSKTEAVLQRRSMLKLGVICKYMKRYGKC